MKNLKYNFRILLLLFFVTIGSNPVNAGSGQNRFLQKQDTIKQKTVCYEVFGMDCPGCQSALEKQIKKIDGVADAKASFKEKKVVIELKPGANVKEEEIIKRIKKANFTPGEKIKPAKDEE